MTKGFEEKQSSVRRDKSDPIDVLREHTSQALEQTEQAIIERRRLTVRFLEEIEVEIASAVRMLRALGEPWLRGDHTEYEALRVALDKALASRKKERRDRLVQSWKDLLELERKRAELLRELRVLDG